MHHSKIVTRKLQFSVPHQHVLFTRIPEGDKLQCVRQAMSPVVYNPQPNPRSVPPTPLAKLHKHHQALRKETRPLQGPGQAGVATRLHETEASHLLWRQKVRVARRGNSGPRAPRGARSPTQLLGYTVPAPPPPCHWVLPGPVTVLWSTQSSAEPFLPGLPSSPFSRDCVIRTPPSTEPSPAQGLGSSTTLCDLPAEVQASLLQPCCPRGLRVTL